MISHLRVYESEYKLSTFRNCWKVVDCTTFLVTWLGSGDESPLHLMQTGKRRLVHRQQAATADRASGMRTGQSSPSRELPNSGRTFSTRKVTRNSNQTRLQVSGGFVSNKGDRCLSTDRRAFKSFVEKSRRRTSIYLPTFKPGAS